MTEIVKDAYNEALIPMSTLFPAGYFYIKNKKIVMAKLDGYAYTNGRMIILTPKFATLPLRQRVLILMHEVLHDFFLHPVRAVEWKNIIDNNFILNLVADAKVNSVLVSGMKPDPILEQTISIVKHLVGKPISFIKESSVEEILRLLPKSNINEIKLFCGLDIIYTDIQSEFKIIQDGIDMDSIPREQLSKEIEKQWRDSLIKSKSAGTITGLEQKLFDTIFEPKIDWRNILRSELISYLGSTILVDYSKEGRRNQELPGTKTINIPRIWTFVDVSGSVWDEVDQFLSEVVSILKVSGDVILILWDTKVKLEKHLRSVSDIKNINYTGGGGTRFYPVISKYIDKIKPIDVLIIITDLEWFDKKEAFDLISQIRCRKYFVVDGKVLREGEICETY